MLFTSSSQSPPCEFNLGKSPICLYMCVCACVFSLPTWECGALSFHESQETDCWHEWQTDHTGNSRRCPCFLSAPATEGLGFHVQTQNAKCVVLPTQLPSTDTSAWPRHAFILSLSECAEKTFFLPCFGASLSLPKITVTAAPPREAQPLSVQMKTNISQPWARCGCDPCDLPVLYTQAGCRGRFRLLMGFFFLHDCEERGRGIDGLHV